MAKMIMKWDEMNAHEWAEEYARRLMAMARERDRCGPDAEAVPMRLQTRYMLHEMALYLGCGIADLLEAVQATGLRGRMIAGTRYWTFEEMRSLEDWLASQ